MSKNNEEILLKFVNTLDGFAFRYAQVFDEKGDRLLIKIKGHTRTVKRKRLWVQTRWYLIKKKDPTVIWQSKGKLGIKEVDELQKIHNFITTIA